MWKNDITVRLAENGFVMMYSVEHDSLGINPVNRSIQKTEVFTNEKDLFARMSEVFVTMEKGE